MLFLDDLVDYFRGLCEAHPDLLHDEASGSRVFEVRNLEDAFSDIRTGSKEKGYIVRMALPTMTLRDQSDNGIKGYQIGLLFAKWHGTRDATKTNIIGAMADAERVADSFITQIVMDSRNGHPLFYGQADRAGNLSLQGDMMMNLGDGSYSGVFYLIEFGVFRCFTGDPAEVFPDGPSPFPQTSELKKLPTYINDEAAIVDGLQAGDFYVVAEGSDIAAAGTVKMVI